MKVLAILLCLAAVSGRVFDYTDKMPKSHRLAKRLARRLFLEDLDMSFNNYQVGQMDNTQTTNYQMEGHNRRTSQMRQVAGWFGDLDSAIDDMRAGISDKLDQLNLALQRPKMPMAGMMNGAIPPMNSYAQYNTNPANAYNPAAPMAPQGPISSMQQQGSLNAQF